MKLVDVLLPKPQNFYIYTANSKKARISGYNQINLDFVPSIYYKNGKRFETTKPTIHYTIYMSDIQKTQLASLFDKSFNDIFQTKLCYLGFLSEDEPDENGEFKEYIFKGKASAIPSFLSSSVDKIIAPRLKEIKISLCLDNVGPDILYEEITASYKEYCDNNEIPETSRFELMEI